MPSRFGIEIQHRIRERRLSVNRLASMAGLGQPHLQMVIKGSGQNRRSISQADAARVLDALGIKGRERQYLVDLAALTLLPKAVSDEQRRRLEEIVAKSYL